MERHLQLLQGHLLLADVLEHEVAGGLDAARVVLHVQGDGTPGLGASSNVVELEAHEGLHQSCMPASYNCIRFSDVELAGLTTIVNIADTATSPQAGVSIYRILTQQRHEYNCIFLFQR